MKISDIYSKNIALFAGIDPPELEKTLNCIAASIVCYSKGTFILMAGEKASSVGIVLSGQASVYKDDILGNRSMIASIPPAHLFAESFICAGINNSPVTVEASADSEILFISFKRIMETCSSCCLDHNTLIKNMLSIIANKNLNLNEKIDHIAKKTTKQKLASYLIRQATVQKNRRFSISLDRQHLADYLCVNRSALSRELSKISKNGILSYSRNAFSIHDLERLEDILLDK